MCFIKTKTDILVIVILIIIIVCFAKFFIEYIFDKNIIYENFNTNDNMMYNDILTKGTIYNYETIYPTGFYDKKYNPWPRFDKIRY